MTGEMCGKDLKKKLEIKKRIEKQRERFLIPWQIYKHIQYL